MRDHDVFLERALQADDLISPQQLETVRRHSADNGVDLVDALIQTESMDSRHIALIRADLCEAPFVDLAVFEPNLANTKVIPRLMAERYEVFPLFKIDDVLTIAMDDPLNLEALDQVRQIARCEVEAVLADRQRLRTIIARAYSLGHSQIREGAAKDAKPVVEDQASGPVVQAVNQMLADAIEAGASDIHVNPDERELRLRYRIDGVLQERQGPPLSMHAGMVQRIKVMAHLDLTQTRRPQDGKFRYTHASNAVEVRVSTVPTVCGENVVLRLLASTQRVRDFSELGVSARMAVELESVISQPYGMLLMTGPTGSGKTTTLYTLLSLLNDPSSNVITIEDPVEIRMPYARQIQVMPEIGLTFANALRSVLRQDPNVILVGEIRDEETATLALQAALTGHMVLSTLHTNDASGAIARLRDFGLPPFVINSSLLGVVAQRLARRVCQHCVGPVEIEPHIRQRFKLSGKISGFVRGGGCGRCGQTGYRGRIGLYELLNCTGPVTAAIEQGVSTARLREIAVAHGMHLMWQDGLEKARLGQTTLEEVAKVAMLIDLCAEGTEAREAA